jgi:hypothetical protein
MIAYPRTALARDMVAALQGRALLGDAHNGLFLAAPRRTGKSTFLQGDLAPALQAAGVEVVYVDLWADPRRDPGALIAEAIARATVSPEAAGRTFELGGPAVMTFEDVLKLIRRETYRTFVLVPLPFFAARAIGSMAQLTTMVGIAPVLTRDQVTLLESDTVVADGAEGLAALGIEPTGIEAIAPTYLWRYRRGGQFAEAPAA